VAAEMNETNPAMAQVLQGLLHDLRIFQIASRHSKSWGLCQMDFAASAP
jgi:hypothetical protein